MSIRSVGCGAFQSPIRNRGTCAPCPWVTARLTSWISWRRPVNMSICSSTARPVSPTRPSTKHGKVYGPRRDCPPSVARFEAFGGKLHGPGGGQPLCHPAGARPQQSISDSAVCAPLGGNFARCRQLHFGRDPGRDAGVGRRRRVCLGGAATGARMLLSGPAGCPLAPIPARP